MPSVTATRLAMLVCFAVATLVIFYFVRQRKLLLADTVGFFLWTIHTCLFYATMLVSPRLGVIIPSTLLNLWSNLIRLQGLVYVTGSMLTRIVVALLLGRRRKHE